MYVGPTLPDVWFVKALGKVRESFTPPAQLARAQCSQIGVWGRAPGANTFLMHKLQKHCELFLYYFSSMHMKKLPD